MKHCLVLLLAVIAFLATAAAANAGWTDINIRDFNLVPYGRDGVQLVKSVDSADKWFCNANDDELNRQALTLILFAMQNGYGISVWEKGTSDSAGNKICTSVMLRAK